MKKWIVIMILLIGKQMFCQTLVSIDSLSGFSCFDSITEINVWRTHKIYFSDSTIKEDVRFRIWGNGCPLVNSSIKQEGKCFYKFQRQTYFELDQIEEKEGGYGWFDGNLSKTIYHQMIYNRKGKLLFVQKVKRR